MNYKIIGMFKIQKKDDLIKYYKPDEVNMIAIDLPGGLEKQFKDIVREDYNGDLQAAITTFLRVHKKFGWKEQLQENVESIRSEVRKKGGIKIKTIDDAIKQYRKTASG